MKFNERKTLIDVQYHKQMAKKRALRLIQKKITQLKSAYEEEFLALLD